VKANIGFLRLNDRQYESAAVLFRQAISEIEIASGIKDPALIRPLINLAVHRLTALIYLLTHPKN
jgi:hypothetical protein